MPHRRPTPLSLVGRNRGKVTTDPAIFRNFAPNRDNGWKRGRFRPAPAKGKSAAAVRSCGCRGRNVATSYDGVGTGGVVLRRPVFG